VTVKLSSQSRQVAHRILGVQMVVALVFAALFLFDSLNASGSALIGGLICVIPNGLFVIYAHRYGGAQAARQIVNSFYVGESIKLMSTALMFALTFIFVPVLVLPLMLTYIACLMAFFSAGLVSNKA